jgi:PAS domain S-box-containing protein
MRRRGDRRGGNAHGRRTPCVKDTGTLDGDDLVRDVVQMRQSEVRYRRLFEAARDGILLLDVETGRITDANPFMSELLVYPHDQLVGKELWQIGLFADQTASQMAFLQLRKDGYVRYEDLPLQASDGARREVEFVSNVYQEAGRGVIQCNIRDITARKTLERDLQQAFQRERRITEVLQRPLTMGVVKNAFPGLQVASLYVPALDEALVGGDFLDAFALPAGSGAPVASACVAIVIADASGKGLAAAVRAIQVKDVLRAFARESPSDPVGVVARLNRFVCDTAQFDEQGPEGFTCLIFGVLDPLTGDGAIVTAGCGPPLLVRADGTSETVAVADPTCLPLGILRDALYIASPLHLSPGDTLVMLTDGITEARRGNDFLGYSAMVVLATQACAEPILEDMGRAILAGAVAYGSGVLRDDACILLARRAQVELRTSRGIMPA